VPIINFSNIENNTELKTDFCIIGAGMSGQIVASNIANKKIILVESGDIDYNKEIQELNSLDQTGLKFRKDHVNRIRQLGGSANLWANQLMLFEQNEISKRDWLCNDLDWPLDYSELKLNYKEVINSVFNNFFNKLNYFNLDDEKKFNFFLENEFLKESNFSLKNHFWPPNVEKFNYKSNFTKKLINKKNIDFLSNFTATEIKIDQNKQLINEVTINSKNKKCKIKANYFVLSSGAIENARILLNNEHKYKILRNNNTGRYFMDHLRVNLGTLKSNRKLPLSILFGIKNNYFDLKKSIKISNYHQEEKKILSCHAYIDPLYDETDNLLFEKLLMEIKKTIKLKGIPKIKYKDINIKKIIEQVYIKIPPQLSSSKLNSLIHILLTKKDKYLSFDKMTINYQGEQMPNFNSKVYLSDKKDKYDQKTLVVDWKLSSVDHETQNEFIRVLKKILTNNSFISFTENKDKIITDASHHSGTTRMSAKRSDGVVDKNCKFHDIKNLYISGSSVFRTIASGNPALTNMALSNRLGKFLNNL